MTSIKDIARVAGVSTATVSYALNGGSGVSAETRVRIQKLAKEMNYTPYLSARILVSQSSQLVCALVDSYQTDANNDLLQILEEQFQSAGYQMLTTSQIMPELQQSDLFSGMIVLDLGLTNAKRDKIMSLNRPTIFLAGAETEETISLMTDNVGGMRLAYTEMRRSVHHKLCIISGRPDSFNNWQRVDALRTIMNREQPDFDFDQHIYPAKFSSWEGYHLGLKLVDHYDAFLCLNDAMALGIYRAAFEHGLMVGKDISVIGFDNSLVDEYVLPGLTTIGFDRRHWAEMVVATYLRLARGEAISPRHQLITAELIERGSVRKS
ncbi:LacI family DNA-binding transcriptional regulator [Schleiferilactobacillus harbinensis]|uniref:LacI family DNA-binding transcriptional regulator n=1 Tax=Schleiferilactobacillus harbinensis TaxID=304207 RepID=UPI0039EBD798